MRHRTKDNRKCGESLTEARKAVLLMQWGMLDKDEHGRRIGSAALEAEFGLACGYIAKYLLPHIDSLAEGDAPFKFDVSGRKPSVYSPRKDAFMEQQAEKWEGDFSWQEMADAIKEHFELEVDLSDTGCRKHAKKQGWTDTRRRTLPYLTGLQKTIRKAWPTKEKKNKWTAWVDVDEKWFYMVKLHGRRKQAPGKKIPPRYAKSKTQIPKVMFLAAAARPRAGFDGKVGEGIWRVAFPKKAQNKSKNHARGDVYDKDGTMTSERYQEMMSGKVFPAIIKSFAGTGIKRVIVQQDGARPHTGKDSVKKLNDIGAKLSPQIEVRTQPAQSPDMNVCDLTFFRALDVAVRKRRRGMQGVFDKEQLVRDVTAEFKAYPTERLERMWEYKSYVMEQVSKPEIDGGNDYERHRKAGRAQ